MLSSAPHRRRRRAFPWVPALLVVLAAAAAGAVVAVVLDSDSNNGTAGGCDVTSVAKQELPAMVTINVSSASGAGSVGSGEIIRSTGYILTNNHVVAPAVGGGTLQVRFENGNTARADLVGRDPLADLAVIRVSGQSGLQPISIGDSSKLRIGQGVVALGSPLGLSSTVTAGIVSALGRSVNVPGEGSKNALLLDAVQTDAAINPGNSGGALLNCASAMVGIPSAGAGTGESSGNIGLGFAIPVNAAMQIAGEIISTGKVSHAYLGLDAQPDEVSALGQGGSDSGLTVTEVQPRGPASAAGLQTGDLIRSISGSPATSTDQLMALTLTKRPGEQVGLGYARAGKPATATIKLGREP